jgi:hypothetical protein
VLLDSPLIPLCVGTQQEAAVFPVIFHPPVGDWLKTLWSQWDRLEIIGGILFRKFESNYGQSTIKQMIVPQSKKQDILHYFHDIPSAGHLGVDKILEKLKTGFCLQRPCILWYFPDLELLWLLSIW